jgi:hypothetical protein
MSPMEELAVERFVRYPNTLSEEERAAVERLLRTDPVAREVAQFFRSYYAEFDDLFDEEGEDSTQEPPGAYES